MIKSKIVLSCLLVFFTIVSGCSSDAGQTKNTVSGSNQKDSAPDKPTVPVPSEAKSLTPIKLVEAWYAKGEDGGYFAALQQDYYKETGIDMTIQPGGPQVSALQMVASGKADFGISYGDEILKAREQGIPVVALLSAFQYSPQVFMYHAGEQIESFEDLNGRAVYVTPGALYWEYIKKKYKLDQAQEFAYSGQLVNFINDAKSLNQGYITNEPYALQQQNVDISYLKVKDSGYANYADILFTTEDYIAKHPDIVEAMVKASQKGWNYYLDNYKTVNPFIQTYNKDMPVHAMDYEAEHQKEFILTDETKERGIGYMTEERWATIQEQMMGIHVLTKQQDVSKAFTTQFLD